MKHAAAVLAAALCLVSAGPASAGPVDWNDFAESAWTLLDAQGRPDAGVEIEVAAHGLEYRDGCHLRVFGIQSESGRLKPSSAGIRSSCYAPSPADARRLASFETALARATRARLDGDRLTLTDATGGALLRFQWIRPNGFERRPWRIVSYARGSALVEPSGTRRDILDPQRFAPWSGPTIYFSSGRFTGSALCMGLDGAYRHDGGGLTLTSGPFILGGFCFEENIAFDTHLRGVLHGPLRLQPHGDGWALIDETGATKAVLAPTTSAESPLLRRAAPRTRAALTGHHWRIARSELIAAATGGSPTASIWFASNGRLRVLTPCASVVGHYVLDGTELFMSGHGWPEGSCPSAESSRQLLETVNRVRSVRATVRRAKLLDEAGRVLFELERLQDAPAADGT